MKMNIMEANVFYSVITLEYFVAATTFVFFYYDNANKSNIGLTMVMPD